VIAALLFILPVATQAQDFTYSTSNNEITITGYFGPAGGTLIIPDTITDLPVTGITVGAFAGDTSLTGITIPDSVISIGAGAFDDCSNLTNATIGNSVTSIGAAAFQSCVGLTDMTIPDSVISIGGSAFSYCSGLVSVTIGSSLTSIGDQVFLGCSSLTSVTIPDSVAFIGEAAFSSCGDLASVTIGGGVTGIGGHAFESCIKLTGVTIPDSVTTIGDLTFFDCRSLTSTTLGSGITSIGVLAFGSCTNLTDITIPDGVTSVGQSAFSGCIGLTNITVGSGNTAYSSVDGVLFNKTLTTLIQCPGGRSGSYTIPDDVTTIGGQAFGGCPSLLNVMIPSSVASIGNSAFYLCASLTDITVDAANNTYSSVDGVLLDRDRTTVIQCPGGKSGSFAIPGSVTNIGDSAFYACASLTDLTVDAASNTFSSVDGVLFDKDQTTLILCPGGKSGSFAIPDGVTGIANQAFKSCRSLAKITIPDSVAVIGFAAFSGCYSLTAVYFEGDVPTSVGAIVFPGSNNAFIYYLPGTTGWEASFAGRPTVLWNPTVPINDPSFGIQADLFGFTVTGTDGLVIVVEAAADLANPEWSPVSTNTLTGGSSYFSDPDSTSHPVRYFRLRAP